MFLNVKMFVIEANDCCIFMAIKICSYLTYFYASYYHQMLHLMEVNDPRTKITS